MNPNMGLGMSIVGLVVLKSSCLSARYSNASPFFAGVSRFMRMFVNLRDMFIDLVYCLYLSLQCTDFLHVIYLP